MFKYLDTTIAAVAISEHGKLLSGYKVLKPFMGEDGYLQFTVPFSHPADTRYLHIEVARHHGLATGTRPKTLAPEAIGFKDEDRSNCNVENLFVVADSYSDLAASTTPVLPSAPPAGYGSESGGEAESGGEGEGVRADSDLFGDDDASEESGPYGVDETLADSEAEAKAEEPADFTQIKGIGAASDRVLHDDGIDTFAQFAAEPREHLQSLLKKNSAQVKALQDVAKQLT